MAPKYPLATWPPFLSASLCHHATYAGPPLWQLYFHQTWPFQIDEVWITMTWSCWQGSEWMILAATWGIWVVSGSFRVSLWSPLRLIKHLFAWVEPSIHPQHSQHSQMDYHKQDVRPSLSWLRLTVRQCSVNSPAPLPSPYLPWVPYQVKAAPVLTLWERLSVLLSAQSSQWLLAIVCHS